MNYILQEKTIRPFGDVFTTGQTVHECAKVLRKAGAKRIEVFTLQGRFRIVSNSKLDPVLIFPLVLISPLLIISSIQLDAGRPTNFDAIQMGNWII